MPGRYLLSLAALTGAGLAQAAHAATAIDFPPPAAAIGAWREAVSVSADPPCKPQVLTLAPAPSGAAPGDVSASLFAPGCPAGSTYDGHDFADRTYAWRGRITQPSGRVLVSLRPVDLSDPSAANASLTLWLSRDGCRLTGVRKASDRLRVFILRSERCAPEPTPKK